MWDGSFCTLCSDIIDLESRTDNIISWEIRSAIGVETKTEEHKPEWFGLNSFVAPSGFIQGTHPCCGL